MRSSSPIRFTCASCGKKLQAPADSAGAEGNCPACGAQVLTPSVSEGARKFRTADLLALFGIIIIIAGTSDAIDQAKRSDELRSKSQGGASAPGAAESPAGHPEGKQ
jgi:DNA-directed RNA polymerase subunit RPC12/RpoP